MDRTMMIRLGLGLGAAIAAGALLWVWMGESVTRASIVRGAGLLVFGLAIIAFALVQWRKGQQ